jgi:hypothetical protein
LEDREDGMFQHPDTMQALVDSRLEEQRRMAAKRRLAHLARSRRAIVRRRHRSWTSWVTRPRRTRSAPKPTIA